MEGRKFGVGLCVVTQQPKNVDPKVLAQINTFVVMGLGDRGDRDIIIGSAKQDLSKDGDRDPDPRPGGSDHQYHRYPVPGQYQDS